MKQTLYFTNGDIMADKYNSKYSHAEVFIDDEEIIAIFYSRWNSSYDKTIRTKI